MKTVLKVLAALAAVAGVIYIIATFGDKIVAWAKKLLPTCEVEVVADAEEAPVEEEEPADDDTPVEEVIVEEATPVAEEADFEA